MKSFSQDSEDLFIFDLFLKKKFKLVLSWNLALEMEFIYLTVNCWLIMDGMVFL